MFILCYYMLEMHILFLIIEEISVNKTGIMLEFLNSEDLNCNLYCEIYMRLRDGNGSIWFQMVCLSWTTGGAVMVVLMVNLKSRIT